MNKKLVQYIHVHKRLGQWTVHNSKGCFHFDSVEIKVPCEKIHKPEKKDNPRFFIKCRGTLQFVGGKAEIV